MAIFAVFLFPFYPAQLSAFILVSSATGNGVGYENTSAISANSDGTFLLAGDSGAAASSVAPWLAKYDQDMVRVSSVTALNFGESVMTLAMARDSAGNVYVTGGAGKFDGSVYNIFLAKYDSSLVFQSSVTYDGCFLGTSERGAAVEVDGAGNIWVGGYSCPAPASGLIFWVGKFDSSLTLKSTATIGNAGASPGASGIAFDASGDVLVIGTPSDKLTIARYDQNLVLKSSLTFCPQAVGSTSRGEDIKVDPSGVVWVTGNVKNGSSGNPDIWVGKYSSGLVLLASATVNGTSASPYDTGYGIAVDNSGHVWVTGAMEEPAPEYTNIWLGRFSPELSLLESLRINGPDNKHDYGRDLDVDPKGDVFATGTISWNSGVPSRGWAAKYQGPGPGVFISEPQNNSVKGSLPSIYGTAYSGVGISSVKVSISRASDGYYWGGSAWAAAVTSLDAALWSSSWTYSSVPALVHGGTYTVTAKAQDTSSAWSMNYATSTFHYQDLSSPGSLSTLAAAAGVPVGALDLSWPAPGNNGASGALGAGSGYYIQYATYSAVAWSTAAAQVVRSTSGVVPGTAVRHVIGGLDPGTTYYAAVWHKDEAGNFSNISNIPSGYARQFPGGTITRTVLGPDRWSVEFNSVNAGDDLSGGSAMDAAGNLYVGKHVYNGSNTDMAVLKFSPDGTLLLAKYFNGEDNCSEGARPFPAVDNSDGSFYLAGHECRTAGPGAGVIIKYDRYGARLWQRRVVGAGSSAVQGLTKMVIDQDGYLYVSGTLTNASNNADMYVGKFDGNGDQLWANTYNSSVNTEAFNSLVVVGTSVYASGYSDQGAQSNNGYVRGINAVSGATQWTYSYNSPSNLSDGFSDVTAGADGSAYFSGQTHSVAGDADVLLQKRTPGGALAWTRSHSFSTGFIESVEGMATGTDGYVYTANVVQTAPAYSRMAVTRFNADGDLAGQFNYTQGAGLDWVHGLISSGTYLFLTGHVAGAGGLNSYVRKIGLWEIPDPFPPAAVGALAATAVAPDKVLLSWQNPGDDGTSGVLYYSTFAVMHSSVRAFAEDQSNWVPASAQIVISTSGVAPGAWSSSEGAGLSPDTTYYFRAWVKDDSGNYGPLSQGATVQTLAYPPAGLVADGVYVSSVDLSWNFSGNPAWTRYEVWRTTDPVWLSSAAVALAQAGPDFADTGLAPQSTYYYKVRARNGQGSPTVFSAQLKVNTNISVMSPAWLAANAVSSTSLTWVWAGVQEASGYRLEASTGGPVSGDLPAGTVDWAEHGLSPNTPYSRTITAFNVYGASVSVPATRYTRAQVPSGLTVTAVYVTSAALTWSMGINPEGTVSHVERSTGGIYSHVVYEGSATVAVASGLQYCTDYDFAVKALNGDGIGYDYSGVASARTKDYPAMPPSGLAAEPLGSGRISLNWGPSPSPHTSVYRLYYDGGDGSVDYSAALAELPASATSYVTGALVSSAAYTFALRAVNRCGVEEQNAHVLASAASVPALSAVKASIKEPHSGKKVSGNRLTVIAELTQGEPWEVGEILFQYRPAGGAWQAVPAANSNHPNPDQAAPYFVHWDVSALAAGNYDLRAVAYDVQGSSDQAPAAITVRVDNADFEVKETLQGDGKVKKEQLIANTVASVVAAAAEDTPWVTRVAVPSGAVSASTVTLAIVNNPAALPPQAAALNPVGQAAEITLSNGQHQLGNGQTAEVILTYPDDDGDGLVDGSQVKAERLKIYSYDAGAGAWKADLACRVDKEKRQVIGSTPHFSYFAVFAPMASAVSSARAYPNPWKPGSGGRFDAAAVTFDDLPADALVQIFTIGGQLVRELRVTAADSGTKAWDGRNSSGSKAASGVYLVLVRSGGKSRTFKLGVER